MATQSIPPIAASATSSSARTSLILALHARYEQSLEDHNKVEIADRRLDRKAEGEDLLLSFRYEGALKVMQAERDHLVRAILYQVPTTDEELAVVAMHLWALYDADADDTPATDLKAIEVALENLFDYLISEGRADMEKIGRSFHQNAMLAFYRRGARQAKLDGEA